MDWKTVEQEISRLATKIHHKPDAIIAIVRGGLVPARLIARELDVKSMYCLSVEKAGETRILASEITTDLRDMKVLVVEDMLETGKSLMVARDYLTAKGAIVEIACLYVMPMSAIQPDCFLKQVENPVHFPWE